VSKPWAARVGARGLRLHVFLATHLLTQEASWSYTALARIALKWTRVQTPCLSPRSTTAQAGPDI